MKRCIACGMPMENTSDYPGGDRSKEYCRFCAREDGSMQSYDEKLEGMAAFLVKTQGLEQGSAREVAVRSMARLPAWKGMATA